jgi:hypothetical protein
MPHRPPRPSRIGTEGLSYPCRAAVAKLRMNPHSQGREHGAIAGSWQGHQFGWARAAVCAPPRGAIRADDSTDHAVGAAGPQPPRKHALGRFGSLRLSAQSAAPNSAAQQRFFAVDAGASADRFGKAQEQLQGIGCSHASALRCGPHFWRPPRPACYSPLTKSETRGYRCAPRAAASAADGGVLPGRRLT